MIRSFRDKATERLFRREGARRFPPELQRQALRNLVVLDGAETLQDLLVPPGNRLGEQTVTKKLAPIHPGEILQEEFLRPMGISQYRLAKSISVPPRRINELVHGNRGVTADTALRLSRFFGTSERFWMNLQARYELEIEKDRLGNRLNTEVIELAQAS
jgi:addiction module HigA family antidote